MLLIGGDAAHQRFCESFLEAMGVAVDAVRTFQDGLRALAEFDFELVIVDSRTRGIDFDAWTQLLRAQDKREPLIYLATDDGEPTEAAIGRRCDLTILVRPVRAVDLVRAVERLRRR